MSFARLVVASSACGLVCAVGLAWPWNGVLDYGQSSWVLQLAGMLLYARQLYAVQCARQAAMAGFAFHCVLLLVSLSWLEVSMAQYGGLPSAIAWAAVVLLSAFLSLYGAAAAWIWKQLAIGTPTLSVPLFGATWLLAELARGQWFTGFGWASAAYAHVSGPFAWAAPWVGGYGIGALVALCAAAAVRAAQRHGRRLPLVLILLVIVGGHLSHSARSTAKTTALSVELLQGNIAQDEKFQASTGVVTALRWYGERLKASRADVVLAPETAIPILPQQLPDDYWTGWRSPNGNDAATKLIGIPMGDAVSGYTNSIVGFMAPKEDAWYRYDKHHLVPFGEFIPPLFQWFVRMMHIPLGDFERGGLAQPAVEVRGERIAPAICFEDLFSEELATRFKDPAQSPTVLANFSNLAWFGASTAMYQHLNISRMRSLEFARPALRVSNTGVTAVVEHDGTVSTQLEPMTQGVLRATVTGRTGLTPYAWWASRWGQMPLWGGALVIVALGIIRCRRTER